MSVSCEGMWVQRPRASKRTIALETMGAIIVASARLSLKTRAPGAC